jgi:hypothetical protein
LTSSQKNLKAGKVEVFPFQVVTSDAAQVTFSILTGQKIGVRVWALE